MDGKIVALPMFTDAPALYYRTDLLEKHGFEPPTTWVEMAETAQAVMEAERAEGNAEIWGFVWQGSAYEGLTCNALEWVKSNGGGQIVEPDGEISINNENAAEAIDLAKTWPGHDLAARRPRPTRGGGPRRLAAGNPVFMRNWPYASRAEQWRRSGGPGQVRGGAAADGPSGDVEGRHARRLEPRCPGLLAEQGVLRSRWPSPRPAPRSRRTGPS